MHGRRDGRATVVALTLVALTWMAWDLQTTTDAASAPEFAALAAFAPVQHLAATVTRPVHDVARWVADQRALHERLRVLRAADARLRVQQAVTADLAAENATLRRLLEMRARRGLRSVGARALGATPGDVASGLVIAAGDDRGVRTGMAVIDPPGGLVGRVVDVTAKHARVELVTSASARYAVRVVPGGTPGRLRGTGDGSLVLEVDDLRRGVAIGSRVVTRAFDGSAVPDGIPIGTVAPGRSVGPTHHVRPLARAAALDLVQVVVAPEVEPSSAVDTLTEQLSMTADPARVRVGRAGGPAP